MTFSTIKTASSKYFLCMSSLMTLHTLCVSYVAYWLNCYHSGLQRLLDTRTHALLNNTLSLAHAYIIDFHAIEPLRMTSSPIETNIKFHVKFTCTWQARLMYKCVSYLNHSYWNFCTNWCLSTWFILSPC